MVESQEVVPHFLEPLQLSSGYLQLYFVYSELEQYKLSAGPFYLIIISQILGSQH